jgi:hypothetical protein
MNKLSHKKLGLSKCCNGKHAEISARVDGKAAMHALHPCFSRDGTDEHLHRAREEGSLHIATQTKEFHYAVE